MISRKQICPAGTGRERDINRRRKRATPHTPRNRPQAGALERHVGVLCFLSLFGDPIITAELTKVQAAGDPVLVAVLRSAALIVVGERPDRAQDHEWVAAQASCLVDLILREVDRATE